MQLHFEQSGKGHPLIILHGLFGSLENWRTLSKVLAQSFQVFAIDQRNHGRSPHSPRFTYQVMMEDLHEFMEEQKLPSAYVIGHSMGGKTAMLFALAYPTMVDKLIVVDIAPKAYARGHDDIFGALFSLDLRVITTRHEADAVLAKKLPDLALRQFLLKNLERNESGALRWRIALHEIYQSYPEIMQALEWDGRPFLQPTLFIRGERSEYIKDSDAPTIKALFPWARIATIANVGHWAHAEAPQEFSRTVLDFLIEDA